MLHPSRFGDLRVLKNSKRCPSPHSRRARGVRASMAKGLGFRVWGSPRKESRVPHSRRAGGVRTVDETVVEEKGGGDGDSCCLFCRPHDALYLFQGLGFRV